MAQACINVAAALGAISGPLVIGAMTKGDLKNGWRNFYVGTYARMVEASNAYSGFKWAFGA